MPEGVSIYNARAIDMLSAKELVSLLEQQRKMAIRDGQSGDKKRKECDCLS